MEVMASFTHRPIYLRGNSSKYQLDIKYRVTNLYPGVAQPHHIIYLHVFFLGYGLNDRRFESRQGLGIFLLITASRPALGIHPASYPTGTRDSFPGIKRPEHEAEHLPPSSIEAKNAWRYTSTPQYAFTAWCSVKAQRQFYLLLFQGRRNGEGAGKWESVPQHFANGYKLVADVPCLRSSFVNTGLILHSL